MIVQVGKMLTSHENHLEAMSKDHMERPLGGALADSPAEVPANSQAQPPDMCVKMHPDDRSPQAPGYPI